AEGAAGDAEFGGQGGFAQRGARQQPTGQDGLPDGIGGLVGGALPLDARAQAGDRANHGHESPSGTSRPAPCSPASREAPFTCTWPWAPGRRIPNGAGITAPPRSAAASASRTAAIASAMLTSRRDFIAVKDPDHPASSLEAWPAAH